MTEKTTSGEAEKEAKGRAYAKLFQNATEFPEPVEAKIKEIPIWLNGSLLKNGPGIFSVGPDKYNHFFDGLAVMQRFKLAEGRVYHSCRFLRSKSYQRNMAAQRIVVSEFGTVAVPDPCKNIFSRYLSYYLPSTDFTDNDVVNFVTHGDEVYASSETGVLHRMDMKRYVAVNSATAHPHYDADGTCYNAANGFRGYHIVKIPPKSIKDVTTTTNDSAYAKAEILASIPKKVTSFNYYHSFGMSENYILFLDMPLGFNPLKMMAIGMIGKTYASAMEWKADEPTVFYVINKQTGEVSKQKYTADGFFTFHHANTYELDGCLIVDVCGYEDGNGVKAISIEQLKKGEFPMQINQKEKSNLWRFILPLHVPPNTTSGTDLVPAMLKSTTNSKSATAVLQTDGSLRCTYECVADRFFEFPQYNYGKVNGQKYRYLYGAAMHEALRADKIIKIDLETEEVKEWSSDHAESFPGEPIFVARPGSEEEDDGAVLTIVSNVKDGESAYLLVQDGKTFKELGRAYVQAHIPIGFHGKFIPDQI